MARTLKGNLNGRAAREQRIEDREQAIGSLVDTHGYLVKRKKEKEAIEKCIAIEGERSFYDWYTPIDEGITERTRLIQERISLLEGEKLYTIVDNLLGSESAHPFQVMDAAEAMNGRDH